MTSTVISFRYQASAENFLRTTDQVERRLGTLEKSAGGFGTVLKGALLGVGFAVVQKGIELVGGAFSGSIGAASTFEKTMSGVKAVSNATGEEMDQLSSLALKLGKDTSFSASQAAAGIEELVKGGLTVPQIMDGAAQAVLNLAAAGGVSLPDAAAIAATAMNVFSLKGSDMAHVSDLIAGAANASSLSVTDFKFALNQVGAVADGAGQSFDDVAQAIAVMGAKGLVGSDAGTSLKTMLSNLQPTTKAQTKAMRELGLITEDGTNQFINANGSFKSMAQIADLLQNSTAGLTDAQRQMALETIFGSDAVRAATVFAKSGGAGFAEMAAKMGLVTAESVGLERLNNTAGSIEQLKGSLETAGITIGRVFLPYGRKLIDWGTRAVNAAIPLLETYGPVLAAKVTEGGKALLGFGRDAVAMLGPVKDAAGGLLTAFQTGDFNAAFGPLLAALDAVFGPGTSAKAALFISDLLRNFQLVRDGFLTVQQALTGKWVGDDTVQPAVRAVGDFALRLRDFALTAKDVFFNQVLPAVQQVAGFIRDHMGTIAKVVAIGAAAFAAFSIIATVVGWVTTAIAVWGALSAVVTGGSAAFGVIVALLGGPVTLAIAAIVAIITLLGVAWANNWGDIQGKVAAVWAWLQPVLAALGARLSAFWTDILPQLSAAWESVSTKVIAAATWLWTQAQAIFGAVAGFLVAHGDQIVAVLGRAWALIQNTINTYLGVIGNLVRGLLALISGDWDGAWAYIQNAARIAWDGIVGLVRTAGPLIGKALDGISATVNGWGVALHVWIGGKFSEIGTTIRDRVTQYKNDTGQQFSEMGIAVQNKLTEIGTTIGGKFSEMGTVIRDRLTQYKNDTGQQFSEMGTIIHDRIARYLVDTGQQFSDMGTAVRDKLTQMKNDVGGKFSEIGTGIQGKLAEIQKWWSDGWAAVSKNVTDTWDRITSAVGGAFSELGAAAKTFITVTIPGKFSDARQTVVAAVMGIFEGAGSVLAAFGQWERDRIADVWQFIATDVPAKFSAGLSAVKSGFMTIFEGAGSVKEALGSWLTARIADAWTFISDTLPAKFFAGQQAVREKFMGIFAGAGSVLAAFDAWIGYGDSGIIGTAKTFISVTLPGTFTGAIDTVKDAFMGIFTKILTPGSGGVLFDWFTQAVSAVDTFIATHIPGKFTEKYEAVRAAFMGIWSSFLDAAGNGTLGTWFADTVRSVTSFIGTTVPKVFTDASDTVKNAVLSGFVAAKDAIGGIMGGFGKNAVGALNTVLEKVRSFAEGVRLLVNWVADKLSAPKIEGAIPGATIDPAGLATGTKNWGGGMAWVGEGPGGAGAELAYLPRGAQVMTHAESMGLVRSGAVAPPQSGPAKLPGFAGGLDALGGIVGVLQKGAGWLYDQAKGAVGLGDLSLPGALGDIGGKLAGKVKDWALGSIDKMLKAATPKVAPGGRGTPGAGWGDPSPGLVDARIPGGRALSGMGSTIVSAAHAHGVPTSVFMGILEHESAYGSPNDGLTRYNNFTGLTGNNWTGQTGTTQGMARDFAIFDSRESGINAALDNLTTGLYRDHTLREVIAMWLTGDYNAGIDPTHPQYTVADYLSHMQQVVESLGGRYNPDAVVVGTAAPVSAPAPAPSAPNSPGGRGPVWDGWSPPLSRYSVSQEFGRNDFSEQHYKSGAHSGIDLVGPPRSTVMAGALGTVASAKAAGGYGNAVTIDHGGGIESIYGHLASISTSVRDLLSRGDPLGIQGSTGDSTGDHVHFEIRDQGVAVNPRDYVDFVGMADGGVITEPIVGRGVRSGRGYTFGESGPEGVFNADQMAALGGRGGETHIHHENHYTIQSTEPTVTVEGFKREERREARLRGYGR